MNTGSQLWIRSLKDEIGFGAPLLVGSRLFVNTNQSICALNEAVGVLLYAEPIPHANRIAPLAHSSNLIIAVARRGTGIGVDGSEVNDGSGRFWVLLAENANEKVSAPTVSNERIFVAISDIEGYITIFGLNDFGMREWEKQLDGFTEASPAAAYKTIFIQTTEFIYALNEDDGKQRWSIPWKANIVLHHQL